MAVTKSSEAFRTISEAARELDVPQHVLRHWEEVFGQIRPMRRAGGRRYYRPVDIDILRGVRVLLYDERYTTKGVQKIFKEHGVKYIAELGRLAASGQSIELRPLLDEDGDDKAPPPPQNPFRKNAPSAPDTDGGTGPETGPAKGSEATPETGAQHTLAPNNHMPEPTPAGGAKTPQAPNQQPPALTPQKRRQLQFLLARLEKAQEALDDASNALDAAELVKEVKK